MSDQEPYIEPLEPLESAGTGLNVVVHAQLAPLPGYDPRNETPEHQKLRERSEHACRQFWQKVVRYERADAEREAALAALRESGPIELELEYRDQSYLFRFAENGQEIVITPIVIATTEPMG